MACFGKRGNLSLLSYFKYAEFKHASCYIFISQKSPQNFYFKMGIPSMCTFYEFSHEKQWRSVV